MANPEHVEVVRRGAEAIAEWRRRDPRISLDLRQANFFEADLSGADLSWADLSQADLMFAKLSGANLTRASLFGANLSMADLSGANLGGAILAFANLLGAYLGQANLAEARFSGTSLGRCYVWDAIGLSAVNHVEPSSIGADTLIGSFRATGNRLTPELATFFLGAGVPKELLDALPRILAQVKYYSCFIAYGGPDEEFAKRLKETLSSRGVSCWLYPTDAKPGEPIGRETGQMRRQAEKVIVICSAKGLVRDGLLQEIEGQLEEDPDKLIPISLDDIWNKPGFRVQRSDQGRNFQPDLLKLTYVDFSDPSRYEEALERLLKGLERRG